MSDGSDDNKDGHSFVKEEFNALLDEIKEEVTNNQRKELFKMAELLSSLGVQVDLCQIEVKQKKKEFGIVITASQLRKLKKILLAKVI